VNGNQRRPTLRDVAARVGTTIPTVSKVLSGRSDVSDDTRSAVLAVIAELGYRLPAGRAATTRGSRMPSADLVISGIEGTWANRALIGVERAAVDAQIDLIVSVARDPDDGWLTRLLSRPSHGAVLALVNASNDQLAALAAAAIPVVLLDPVTQPPDFVPSVGAANWDAGRAVAEHLIGLGHHELAIVAGRRDQLYSQARIDGFRSAAESAGATLPPERIIHANWSRNAARDAGIALLTSANPPSAIFACSDTMALGIYEAAREIGTTIPGALSVVGFDDLPEGEWMTPQLTTVRQPIADMGAAALRMLLRMPGRAGIAEREQLSTTLVVRESTASWVE
jgi:DNA-binding LacI/PurR family transcriptional regulator